MMFARRGSAGRQTPGGRGHRLLRGQTAACQEAAHDAVIPLVALEAGATGRVYAVTGAGDFVSRLAAVGFTPRASVTVLQNAGGPVIVLVLDSRVALGRAEASRILVSACAPDGDGQNA